ncbi:histidinol-phosphatase HisJ family protein [Clostridium sp. YIM B02555]|uniref:histidinol-phosphatase HisJ family protein n=1 Tax=Clostridium sp. YIM B02555 TaxID=2911968 RepID=UPI001EEF6784|nr:histidinol-phosphatase HisJ family protein [Clostridium sp. YIM B02555]
MLCDYHLHTNYSDDSSYIMEDLVNDSIDIGLNEICITDHVDYGVKSDWDKPEKIQYDGERPIANVDYPKFYKEIKSLQEKYKNQINIKIGMEFGMQKHTIGNFQKLFNQYNFDFIILSCHQVDDKEFWNQAFQSEKSQKEYNELYYQEILRLVKHYKNYSVLGHLDMIKRYDEISEYPFEKVKTIITDILKIVISDGKGIEINTSSHRYDLNDLTPSKDILRLYKNLGGKILTIGSDTHKKEHLGAYIEATKSELKKLGFNSYCTYENMIPIYHSLDD